ncbi:hypothetical protein Vretimale_9695 [Volvox reticuliferus]|uniref:Uncharacterized protein n=1 Tax=Volvox reticuliferus TaxID=1737510 RepID=A0A8J4CP82_9CHLO|nr:hypothetical protein Vretifemale_13448 [Volvox reticuliferus]GIM05234.1 hypothetical protein Vretimale_9695 [Volvox reticuliferus]
MELLLRFALQQTYTSTSLTQTQTQTHTPRTQHNRGGCRILQCHARSQQQAAASDTSAAGATQLGSLESLSGNPQYVYGRQPQREHGAGSGSAAAVPSGGAGNLQQEARSLDGGFTEGDTESGLQPQHKEVTVRARSAELQYRRHRSGGGGGSDGGGAVAGSLAHVERSQSRHDGSFQPRSAWIGTDRSRRSRRGRSASAAVPSRSLPAALSDERVVPLMRKAERDLLPSGDPNTPWRRLAYQLRLAPSISGLLTIYRASRENAAVWRPHMTALVLTRAGALLYPRAVVATSAVQAGGRTDGAGRFPPPFLKRDATSLFESLSGKVNKLAVRQVQGMHLARALVSMAWLEVTGQKCEALAAALVGELQRQHGGKLAQVALVDPPLFGRLVRALAQLVPRRSELWVDLQRVTLAALMEAQAEAAGAAAAAGPRRVWAGPGRNAVSAAAEAEPQQLKPDCSTADLANMAFGFAAAGAATSQLFAALRTAVLSRELPADPAALARLMCAWGRAHYPPGPLLYRLIDAFIPLLDTAPPRPIGRMVWSLAMMGVRDERFLQAAAKAIVGRQLVFSSPQELVNVVWAYSHLGWQVEEGVEPLRPVARNTATAGVEGAYDDDDEEEEEVYDEGEEDEDGLASRSPRGVLRQALAHQGSEKASGTTTSPYPALVTTREMEEQQQGQLRTLETAGESAGSWQRAEPVETQRARDDPEWTPLAAQQRIATRSGRMLDGNSYNNNTSSSSSSSSSSRNGSSQSSVVEGCNPGDENGEVSGAMPAAALSHRLPPLKPLPLAAPLAALEQARQTRLQQPQPEYPEHYALYRYLGRSFIHRTIGSAGGGAAVAPHHTISHSQLAAMVGSFARAGYRNKQLFYTAARIALLRLQYLSPGDLTLILSAHARLRIAHTGLFEAASPIIAARCCEFTSAQLADAMWAVQVLMPEGYMQLANAVRVRRGWLPPPSAVPPSSPLDNGLEEGEEVDMDRKEERHGRGEGGASQARSRTGGSGSNVDDNASLRHAALLPSLMRLRVPRELLEDVDWIEAEEADGVDEEEAGLQRQRDGSMWDRGRLPNEDGGYWGREQAEMLPDATRVR